jgi:hypothetical protein
MSLYAVNGRKIAHFGVVCRRNSDFTERVHVIARVGNKHSNTDTIEDLIGLKEASSG